MHYRPATVEDLDEICCLIRRAIELMEQQGIFQWDELYPAREDFLEDINNNSLYLAVEDDRIIAVYVINQECDEEYHKCDWKNPQESACIIHRFCVSPDFQNKGIGSKVLSDVEEQIRGMGYKSIRLDVFSGNPYALRLYEKKGYEKRGHADWRKGRFFLMEKTL
ncbi:MAG: GNAT family N-acetyltransferase [Clostridiales bacterium]|nr:GNAT family N-acetyltransferase [Clostridiales bacterium]